VLNFIFRYFIKIFLAGKDFKLIFFIVFSYNFDIKNKIKYFFILKKNYLKKQYKQQSSTTT